MAVTKPGAEEFLRRLEEEEEAQGNVEELLRSFLGLLESTEEAGSLDVSGYQEEVHLLLGAMVRGEAIHVLRPDTLVTSGKAAEILGMSLPTLRKQVRLGRLQAQMVGSHMRFAPEVLEAFREERETRDRGMTEIVQVSEELAALGID